MNAGQWKDFATKSAMNRAIIKAGLQAVPHGINTVRGRNQEKRWQPEFWPELSEDREYIRSKGFLAIKNPHAA